MKKSDPNPNPTSSSSSASKTQNDSLDESSSDSKIAKITSVKITLLARTLRQHLNAVWRHAEGILKQVVERMREGDMSDVGAEGVKRVVDCCRQLGEHIFIRCQHPNFTTVSYTDNARRFARRSFDHGGRFRGRHPRPVYCRFGLDEGLLLGCAC